jgi:hypothetical protein
VATSPYTYTLTGTTSEGIATNYSTAAGNAFYSATTGTLGGPGRVGMPPANPANSGRMTAGASYWGIMELSGNLYERPITVGNTNGRAFTGTHGNGELASTGNHDAATWPGIDANGSGYRGGAYVQSEATMRTSSRAFAAETSAATSGQQGGRGVRTAP